MNVTVEAEAIAHVPYLRAASGGGVESAALPILRGAIVGLSCDGLEALLIASDLQGMAMSPAAGGESRLLGEVLAETCFDLADEGLLPPPDAIGIILGGDLYSSPTADERGASGDVRDVWAAFHAGFRWVVGVAGNHDQFGSERERQRFFARHENAHCLDGEVCERDGLRIGGVSLITGKPGKPGRREEVQQLQLLRKTMKGKPDLLVLHEGPPGQRGQKGNAAIGENLARASVPLVLCGHTHWHDPLASLGSSTTVLNVDSRAVLLLLAAQRVPNP